MIVFERSGLPQLEFALPAEQLDYDVIVVRVCDFFWLAAGEVEDIALACCLCENAYPFQGAVFDVSVKIVSSWEDDEGWTIQSIFFEVGNCEKVLQIEEQSESFRESIPDGSLILGVSEVNGAKESLFRHNLLIN